MFYPGKRRPPSKPSLLDIQNRFTYWIWRTNTHVLNYLVKMIDFNLSKKSFISIDRHNDHKDMQFTKSQNFQQQLD